MLNVAAARLARCHEGDAAVHVAAAAATLEASRDFERLKSILSGLSPDVVGSLVSGVFPEALPEPERLWSVMQKLARQTERLRTSKALRGALPELLAGCISEFRGTTVVLTDAAGQSSLVPRWLALAVHRECVGGCLAVVTDRIGSSSALAFALPAIDLDQAAPTTRYSPFGKDPRTYALSEADMRKLSGEPAPLRVLVPVAIGE